MKKLRTAKDYYIIAKVLAHLDSQTDKSYGETHHVEYKIVGNLWKVKLEIGQTITNLNGTFPPEVEEEHIRDNRLSLWARNFGKAAARYHQKLLEGDQ